MTATTTAMASTRDYFDARSAQWNEERSEYFTQEVQSFVIGLGGFAAGDRVMDYGAGAGFLTRALLDSGVREVLAADISPRMLEQIGTDPACRSRVDLRLVEGETIPTGDGELDGIVTNMVLHHIERPSRFFAEARRVLRPGGLLIVTDMLEHDNFAFQRAQHDHWPGFALWRIEDWLRQAGFPDARTGMVGQRCCGQVRDAYGGFEIFYCAARA